MVDTQFGAILKEFETFFRCSLKPDANNSCLIKLKSGLEIQIELDRYGLLLIGCRIAALPFSRYRDNLIQQALKSNEAFLPSQGVFGFSQKSNQIILFIKLDPTHLRADQILSLLPPFINRAKQWKEAIARGETPTVASSKATANTPSGLFGLLSK
jgi:hypothetical protein